MRSIRTYVKHLAHHQISDYSPRPDLVLKFQPRIFSTKKYLTLRYNIRSRFRKRQNPNLSGTPIELFIIDICLEWGFPDGSVGKEPICQCRRRRFNPWVKISRKRKWQPAPVFLPGKSHGERRLAGYSPWGHKDSDKT